MSGSKGSATKATGALYLSYNGMLEPLGQSQVLAYLEHLAADRPIHLISFERAADWKKTDEREAIGRRMAAAGIHWHPLRYHKRLSVLATLWDIAAGTWRGWRLTRRHRLEIVHARSYVPAAMALLLKRLTGVRFIFDMRGFWADERVDGGLWPSDGRLHRVVKWMERRFLLVADHVVSLTHAGVREMQAFDYLQGRMPPMTVIPTCADLDRFTPMHARKDPEFVLGYVGSVGTWYLFDATVACFAQLREMRPDARLLIVNRNEHAYIRERLATGGIPAHVVELRAATHAEVPALMARMHATAFFIKPVFSKQASAPTKLAEFLGCGIPVLTNAGVGDMAGILRGSGVGIAVQAFDNETLREGVRDLLALSATPGISARCRSVAEHEFSLTEGVERYRRVYAGLQGSAA